MIKFICAEHSFEMKYFFKFCLIALLVEMGPNPTRAYFWPAVNKRPTGFDPGTFRPEAIFFDPKGKKLKNLTFLGDIFKIQTKTKNVWPDPGQKFLTQTHH